MTFEEFRYKAERSGFHFFDPQTMQWWKTRVSVSSWRVIGNSGLFITSDVIAGVRRFTIRRGDLITGAVKTFGTLGEFVTLAQAKRAMPDTLEDV